MRAPGIDMLPGRVAADTVAPPPLAIASTRVAGFVGVAERGSLDVPVRIAGWADFVAVFGDGDDGYLADSVHGFFANGGDTCWVVRVAHDATCAELVVADGWGRPALRIRALDPGAWGNAITVTCRRVIGATALVVRDVELGACEAHVSSTRGFTVGAVARLHGHHGADHVVIAELGDRLVRWATATPIHHRHPAAGPTALEVIGFDLYVALRDRREAFVGLQLDPVSPSYAPRAVAQRSRLVRIEAIAPRSAVPHHLPTTFAATRLAGGRDGIDGLTADDVVGHDRGPSDRTGLAGLAANDEVAMLAIPDAMWLHDRAPGPIGEQAAQRIQDELVAVCERLEDRMAILDIPRSTDLEWVRRWRRRVDSSYAAYYWPWLEVETRDGGARVVPPSGLIAGCYARRDREGVHHAPANLALVGVRDIALRLVETHVGTLDGDAINTFRVQRGVRAWGARTASSDPAWRHVSVRRLFVMLRRSLDAGFAWIAFEPNDAATWERVRDRIAAFLGELHAAGMLAGGKPGNSFFVRCDRETNLPEEVARGVLRCDVGVAPVAPAEFITISLVHTTTST